MKQARSCQCFSQLEYLTLEVAHMLLILSGRVSQMSGGSRSRGGVPDCIYSLSGFVRVAYVHLVLAIFAPIPLG